MALGATGVAQRLQNSREFDCGVAESTLSHHLKVLRLAGVINHRKEGTRCFVALRPELETAFPGLLASILKFRGAPGELSSPRLAFGCLRLFSAAQERVFAAAGERLR
jgi:DNA-binding transcriptional ArsR family regulator